MTHLLALVAHLALSAPPLDQHGDLLPPGAIARFGTVRFRVGSVRTRHSHALSPDGKLLAVEDRDGIALWDTETGKVTKRLPWRTWQGDNPKFGLCFSPDGKRLARLAGRVVAMWDLATGKELFDIDHKAEGQFQGIGFVPGKDQIIVTGEDKSLARIMDATTGKLIRTTKFDGEYLHLVPAGKWVLGIGEKDWFLFDQVTGKERARFPCVYGVEGESFELSSDGKHAWQVGCSGRLRHCDAETGKKIEELNPPGELEQQRPGLALSPDGAVVYLTHGNPVIHRWDVKARKWLSPIPDVASGVLLPHPDGKRLLVIGNDGVLRRFDLGTRKQLPGPDGFEDSVHALPSPDGCHIAAVSGRDVHRLQVFDPRGRLIWSDGPYGWGCTPHWSPDGRMLAVFEKKEIRLRDPGTGKSSRTIRPPEEFQEFSGHAAFTSGGDRLVVTVDGGQGVACFNPKTGEQIALHRPNVSDVVEISPDGRMLLFEFETDRRLVFYDKSLRLFDLTANKLVADWSVPTDDDVSAGKPGFTPDGSYLLSWELEPQREAWRSRDTVAVLRHPRTAERRKTIAVGLGGRFEWACSPDGLWLAVGTGHGNIVLFDLATGTKLGEWAGHRDYISSIHFAGPGKVVTASGDLTALLWDLRPKQRPTKPLWEALTGTDGKEAWRAVWALAADPKAPELLRTKIVAASAPPADRLKQLLADLGADRYPVREAATKSLQDLGRLVEPELKATRDQSKAEEVRTRLDGILAKISPERTPQELVQARAMSAMELAGTPEAKKLLAEWAAGAPGARLTIDAKAALGRLTNRGDRP